MPRFLFTDINKKILTTENPFLKIYFIYYLTVKFLSDGGFRIETPKKFCLWRFMTRNPQRHASAPLPYYRLTSATSRAALEQIVFRREDNRPLSSRRNTICSRPSDMCLPTELGCGMSARPRNLTALQQHHNLIVVRMWEHIQHARGDRLVGRHARQVSGKGFCVAA